MKPLFFAAGGLNTRWNLDGLLTTSGEDTRWGMRGYAQFFRSGVLEAVDLSCFRQEANVRASYIEEGVIDRVRSTMALLSELDVQETVVVFVSLVNIHGFRLVQDNNFDSAYGCDRDPLMLAEAIIEEGSSDIESALRPVFDSLWQTFGYVGSPRYRDA